MRILLVNDYGTASGGAERQMLTLRGDLRARGHEARLLTSDAVQVPGWPIEADATCRGALGAAQPYLEAWNPWAARAVRAELRRFRPDVVHLRMFLTQLSPSILPELRHVPVLYQAAFYKAVCPAGTRVLPDGSECDVRAGLPCLTRGCVPPPSWTAQMAQRRLARRHWGSIDRVATLSREMRRVFEANGVAVDDVINNGQPERPPRPPLTGPPTVGYAGRLSREKGVGPLIDAFARIRATLPQARLLIAGDGPLLGELRARAAPLGESVAFLGYLKPAALEAVFDAVWVQAAPSIWREPFGNVATEAMMRGTAVLATGAGGFAEMVVDGVTGRLTPPGDTAALAAALLDILGDRARAEAMGAAGRARALRYFSRDVLLARLEATYESLRRDEPENRQRTTGFS